VLAKQLKIDKEVIIVESNSTDGTRDIVKRYEGRPGVRVIYEDGPRGKGHAVRTGLARVTGTIVLIQDADFEYDIDDYDALLEPILQHKATFVLGSRSLGLDDWKVRKYDATPIKGLALNFMQVVFAKTYDVLYQQHVTDVNTMYKVFRAECLDGLNLESDGFDLDIELACKLARNGNSPMEVPVNYVARGFDQGKKIRFWRDGFPSYAAFFKYRFK
jgi:glycosyltransferase involved in cell wall biosynthesis